MITRDSSKLSMPIFLGFVGLDFWYYMVFGLTVVELHQPEDQAVTV